MLRASSVLAEQTVPVTISNMQGFSPRVRTAYGPGRASEPPPLILPRETGIAEVLARVFDRAADEAFAAGRFADADRLTGLVLELRARSTGGRA